MDKHFLAGPRRGRTRVMAGFVGLALVLGAVAAVQHATDKPSPTTTTAEQPATSRGAEVDPETVTEPMPDTSTPAAQEPTNLVAGERVLNGVRVGYPHTLVGAVSATVEYAIQVCSTLDSQRASEVGLVVADSSYGDVAAHFGRGPVNSRRYLGLPESGPVPGASLVLTPMAYQVRDPLPDEVTVLLLVYLTVTTPTAGVNVRTGVYPFRLVWSANDWKLGKRAADAPDFAALRFQPGSPEARTAGWLDFVR